MGLPGKALPVIDPDEVDWENNYVPVDKRTKSELGVTPNLGNLHGELVDEYIFNCNKVRISDKVIESVFMPAYTDVRILRFAHKAPFGCVDYSQVWVHAHGITFKRAASEISITRQDKDRMNPHRLPWGQFHVRETRRRRRNVDAGLFDWLFQW